MCKKWKWSNHQTKFVDFGHYQDWLNIFLRKVKVKSTKFYKLCTLSSFLTIFLDGQWKWNYYEMPKVRIFVPDANLEWQCQIILPSGQIEIRLFIADACSCSNMGWCVDFLYKQLTLYMFLTNLYSFKRTPFKTTFLGHHPKRRGSSVWSQISYSYNADIDPWDCTIFWGGGGSPVFWENVPKTVIF